MQAHILTRKKFLRLLFPLSLVVLLSLSSSFLPSVTPVSAQSAQCARCGTAENEPLSQCSSYFGASFAYLTQSDCSGNSAIGLLSYFISRASATDPAPRDPTMSCAKYVQQVMCGYAYQATVARRLGLTSCQLLPMCQTDCNLLAECIKDDYLNCADTSVLVAPNTNTQALADAAVGKCVQAGALPGSGTTGRGSSTGPSGLSSSTGSSYIRPNFAVATDIAFANSAADSTTKYATLYGLNQTNVGAYLGVPYAIPISGNSFRWTEPLPSTFSNFGSSPTQNTADLRSVGAPSSALTDGKSFAQFRQSNICFQMNPAYNASNPNSVKYIGSEDCLYLNVFTPYLNISSDNYNCTNNPCFVNSPTVDLSGTTGNVSAPTPDPVTSNIPPLLPVMVFLHGGNFANGSAYDVDGAAFVRKSLSLGAPVLVVTLNYRLGVFGWLAHKDISKDRTPYQTSGLYGFEDQRVALKFVKANIVKFGGDPYRITILGDSSGAVMACMHVFSTHSAALFSRAILQGGSCGTIYRTLDTAESIGAQFASAIYSSDPSNFKCVSPASGLPSSCLRSVSQTDLYDMYLSLGCDRFLDPDAPWMGPFIDGFQFDDYIANTIFARTWNVVPIIMGISTMEYAPFIGSNDYNHIRVNATSLADLSAADVQEHASNLMTFQTTKNLPTGLTSINSNGTLMFGTKIMYNGDYASLWTSTDYDVKPLRYTYNSNPIKYADPSQDNKYLDTIVSLYTNYHHYCPQVRIATSIGDPAISDSTRYTPTYVYRFSYQSESDAYRRYGAATQSSMLPYVFGVPSATFNNNSFSANDQQTTRFVQYYWLNFMYNGDPQINVTASSLAGVKWTPFLTSKEKDAALDGLYMHFDRTGEPGQATVSPSQRGEENPPSSLTKECAVWKAVDHPGDSPYYYAARRSQSAGSEYTQYENCAPLATTSFCYGLLNYPNSTDANNQTQMYVNVRGPFTCANDVEHFLLQMPTIVAAIRKLNDKKNKNIVWPILNAALYGGNVPDYLTTDPQKRVDGYNPDLVVKPCVDSFAFTVCRLFYRPCVYQPLSSTDDSDADSSPSSSSSTGVAGSFNGTSVSVNTTSRTSSSSSSSTGNAGSVLEHFNITDPTSVPGFTWPPCGSLCQSYRFYCPLYVTQTVIAPMFDLYLPQPLTYDALFADCTSSTYWNRTYGTNCSVVSTDRTEFGALDPFNVTSCTCYNASTPNYDFLIKADTMKPQALPKSPTCVPYNLSICDGIINYPVYVPAGTSLAEMELYARSKNLGALILFAEVHGGCRESFARHVCSSFFLACDDNAQQRVATDLFHVAPFNYEVPYPRFSCQYNCATTLAICSRLWNEVAIEAQYLVSCNTTGVYAPLWKECKDPVQGVNGAFSRYPSVSWITPVDYPAGNYDYFQYAMPIYAQIPGYADDTNNVKLPLYCNDFGMGVNHSSVNTTIKVVCPYPLVIPTNPDAATFHGGSCATPCANLLWTAEQWNLGDDFFNFCVVGGLICSTWLAVSYTIFPINRQRHYLHMFFISVFCLTLIYTMQILYSSFSPHKFGCKSNSELSRQDDLVLCTLAGASFMYFINASVQWWMVISLDFFNSLVRKKRYTHKALRKQVYIYHLLAWGAPVVFVAIAAGEKALGRTSTVPWCFMVDDISVAIEWGVMWWPLLIRLLLGMIFMGLVAKTMYQQGSLVESRGQGSRWAWFKMQKWTIAIVLFFCLVFLWLVVYRAYMYLNSSAYDSATEDWIKCLIFANTPCGEKPSVYPISLIWYGMIGCVGAQGIACGLFFGLERRNFVLWYGFITGKGRAYFTAPDVDSPSQVGADGGGYREEVFGSRPVVGPSSGSASSSAKVSHKIDMKKYTKKKESPKSPSKGADDFKPQHFSYK